MNEQAVPAPPVLVSDIDPATVLAVFAVLVGIAVIWAIVLTIRRRDILPIVVCVGSLVCALNEPIYDILGKIVYAGNNPMAYNAFGRNIPWFLVIGYLPFVGLLPYLIAQMMAAGVGRGRLHLIAIVSFVSVVVIETFGNEVNAWKYYGDAPLKFLCVAPQMAPVPIVAGFLLYAVAEPLAGWRRLLAGFSISTMALPMVYASTSWPLYFGLYAGLPVAINWILGGLTLFFCAATVVVATNLAERLRSVRLVTPTL